MLRLVYDDEDVEEADDVEEASEKTEAQSESLLPEDPDE